MKTSSIGRALRTGSATAMTVLAGCNNVSDPSPETAAQDSVQQAVYDREWASIIALGGGLDVVSDAPRGDCVIRTTPELTFPNANGAKTEWSISYVRDAQELSRELGVEGSGAMSGATLKAQFADSTKINQYSVFAVVRTSVHRATETMRDVLLTADNAQLVSNGSMADFRRRCGDRFTIGGRTGGELIAIFEFKARSAQQRQAIETDLTANAGKWEASATFSQRVTSLSSKYQLNMTGIKIGGSDAPIPSTADELVTRALSFESEVKTTPAPMRAILSDYSSLGNYQGPSQQDIANQLQVLDQLNGMRLQLQTRLASVEYVLANPSQFTGLDAVALSARADVLRNAINTVRSAWRTCGNDLNQCTIPTLGDVSVNLPVWTGEAYGPHPSCGVESYNVGTGPECGVQQTVWKLGTGPDCGVRETIYRLGRSEACGVALYNERRDLACGVERTYSLFWPWDSCKAGEVKVWMGSGYVCWVPAVCRRPEFGVELYNECRAPAHGVERYIYNECRHPNFGKEYDIYNSCAHSVFGVKTYKSCWYRL